MKVRLVRYTDLPEQIVATAGRTCYSKNSPVDINIDAYAWSEEYLEHQLSIIHGSCYEHATFTFAIEGVSRVLTHQLVRHRLASFSQQSQRYVKTSDNAVYRPMSLTGNTDAEYLYFKAVDEAFHAYEKLVEMGIPKEDARYVLPEGILSNILVTMNARELMHFFGLRCCTRAQEEIRMLANEMLEEARKAAPKIFNFEGAQCSQLGYCPEHRSCGKYPTITKLKED